MILEVYIVTAEQGWDEANIVGVYETEASACLVARTMAADKDAAPEILRFVVKRHLVGGAGLGEMVASFNAELGKDT